MKTILIETVTNGWIVRPFQPVSNWACRDIACIAVYTDLEKLKNDLPRLLEFDEPVIQDMRPETIGGNELCPSS